MYYYDVLSYEFTPEFTMYLVYIVLKFMFLEH